MSVERNIGTRRQFLRENLPYIIGDIGLILYGVGYLSDVLGRPRYESDTLRLTYLLEQEQNGLGNKKEEAIQLHDKVQAQYQESERNSKMAMLGLLATLPAWLKIFHTVSKKGS